jgi:PmbA protein
MLNLTQDNLAVKKNIIDIAAYICKRAKHYNATDASVDILYSQGFDLAVSGGQVSSLEFRGGYSISFTVYFGKKSASMSTSDIKIAQLDNYISQLCDNAHYLEADPYAGLPAKNRLATTIQNLDLYHYSDIAIADHIAMAKQGEKFALGIDPRIKQCEDINVSVTQSSFVLANTHDFIGTYDFSSYSNSCSLLANDPSGSMHRDYDYTLARDSGKLATIETIANNAAQKVIARIGARVIPSASARILFAPTMAKYLVGVFLQAISGGRLYREASFLGSMLGKQIFPQGINIIDDPSLIAGISSSPFDAEGILTVKRHLIKNGELQGYLLSSYTARALGMEATGNAGGAHNVIVEGGLDNHKQMLKKLGTGLYVTEMMGQGVNLVNGDFSRGAFGYWVENGEIKFPVHSITIASNLKTMFSSVEAVGADIDARGGIHTGSWLLPKMTIAGSN